MGSALFAFLRRQMLSTFPEIHLWCYMHWPLGSQSLPHMHVQRWDFGLDSNGQSPQTERMHYHCAIDPAQDNFNMHNINVNILLFWFKPNIKGFIEVTKLLVHSLKAVRSAPFLGCRRWSHCWCCCWSLTT